MATSLPVDYLLTYVDTVTHVFSLLLHGGTETKTRAHLYMAVGNVMALCTEHAVDRDVPGGGVTPRRALRARLHAHAREHADGLVEMLLNDVLNATNEKVSGRWGGYCHYGVLLEICIT